MVKAVGPIDIMGMPTGGGDPRVERLAGLPNNDRRVTGPGRSGPKISSQGGGRKVSIPAASAERWPKYLRYQFWLYGRNPALGVLSDG